MENRKSVLEGTKSILIFLTMGYLVTFVGILILALLLLQFQISESVIDIGIIGIYILSSFLSGFCMGKKMKERKFLWGLAVGVGYFVLLLLISLISQKQLTSETQQLMTCFMMCAGSGTLGGMLS